MAWSAYDAVTGRYRLRLLRDGAPVDPAVAPSAGPLDLDVGPGPDGAPLVVYSRRGDLFQYDPATGRAALAEVNTSAARAPAEPPPRRAGLRAARPRPPGRLPAPRRHHPPPAAPALPARRSAVEDVELSSRGLFVVYRTDIVPTCCTKATLFRIAGGRLRHVFTAPSGGPNLGRIVSPSVAGRNLYFGRTNQGSGQGNRFFRYDLRSRRLFSARGTRRARSLTWRGDRFLMSRSSPGCEARRIRSRPTTPSCELLLTDPIRFTRAARADVRRTRP